MTTRSKLVLLGALAAVSAVVPAAYSRTSASSAAVVGKQLYRVDCARCHLLSQSVVAGFGSDTGLGPKAGPSFDDLRIPYNLAIVAVTEQRGAPGHRIAIGRLTWPELTEIAGFLAAATTDNPRAGVLDPRATPSSPVGT